MHPHIARRRSARTAAAALIVPHEYAPQQDIDLSLPSARGSRLALLSQFVVAATAMLGTSGPVPAAVYIRVVNIHHVSVPLPVAEPVE